jgi:hypothetical protein
MLSWRREKSQSRDGILAALINLLFKGRLGTVPKSAPHQEKTMNAISKIAIFVALVASGSPALAQSFDPDTGSGNVLELNYSPAAVQPPKAAAHQSKAAARQSGLRALARVSGSSGNNSTDPASTGGGSVGYNQMLLQY